MKSKEIRKQFIDFFISKKHDYIRSSPVIPIDDPTLLFTNAGMNQFKPFFLETIKSDSSRVVNSQKCIRVSGKHNDLEEVGVDDYHHTFFEMLGNWSFADYYKKEAIQWHWELLTEVWKLDKERLWVSIYKDDDEAKSIWEEFTDISHNRILKFGDKENFWEMGNTGPCGPCTEIHYYTGDDLDNQSSDGINSSDIYREVCNLVFIQYNRLEDGSLKDLKNKYVDTGLGFERIVAILNGKTSNYETDLFIPLIEKISEISKKPYSFKEGVAHRVIADHLRMVSFSIADGALPSNEGRGYVVRRVLRRASRFGRLLGLHEPFLASILDTLIYIMDDTYPELSDKKGHIERVLNAEEKSFGRTLDVGLEHFSNITQSLKGSTIKGEDAFKLYDTYGFPLDLTELLAREKKLVVDRNSFDICMQKQKDKGRESANFINKEDNKEWILVSKEDTTSKFVGYEKDKISTHINKYRFQNNLLEVVLDETPFYAESGGQVADKGEIIFENDIKLFVDDVQNIQGDIIHYCSNNSTELDFNSNVIAVIDSELRLDIKSNHTATHILHQSLKNNLGEHVQQAGSLVDAEKLRFDLTHYEKIDQMAISSIENEVNKIIRYNIKLDISIQEYEEAKANGACALFGEKYDNNVRVVDIQGFSKELCGGTHVNSTGDIGLFKIINESSVSSGIRRIEAITGNKALLLVRNQEDIIYGIKKLLNCSQSEVLEKINIIIEENKLNEKRINQFDNQKLFNDFDSILDEAEEINDIKLVVHLANKITDIKKIGDYFRQKINQKGILLLGSVIDNKPTALCAVSDDLITKINAVEVVRKIASAMDGGGGGKPHLATAGGKDANKLMESINIGKKYVLERIK